MITKLGTMKLQLWIFANLNFVIRKAAFVTHRRELSLRWSEKREIFFDRNLAIHTAQSNDVSLIFERIIFNKLFLSPGGQVLELGSGDGFAGALVYANDQLGYLGLDNSREAVRFAKRNYQKPNVVFESRNILENFPTSMYTNVIWDAGIGFFSPTEQEVLLQSISKCLDGSGLASDGVLSGFTIGVNIITHQDYAYAPTSKTVLYRVLRKYFKNCLITERKHGEDIYFYFAASNGEENHFFRNFSLLTESRASDV